MIVPASQTRTLFPPRLTIIYTVTVHTLYTRVYTYILYVLYYIVLV